MNFLRRIWYSLRHRRIDEELAEEIESHRAMAQARLERDGLSAGELRRYLFGLSAADPLAHLGVLVVLAVAGAAATFVPARNAARIEPVNALRHE